MILSCFPKVCSLVAYVFMVHARQGEHFYFLKSVYFDVFPNV